MSEVPSLGESWLNPENDEVRNAAHTLRAAVEVIRLDNPDLRIGVGLSVPKDDHGWRVAIRVPDEELLHVASELAAEHIPGVPLDIEIVGRIVAGLPKRPPVIE